MLTLRPRSSSSIVVCLPIACTDSEVDVCLSSAPSTHAETTKHTLTRLRQLKDASLRDVDDKFDATIAESRLCVERADALVKMHKVC
jgi:hypothetical protein